MKRTDFAAPGRPGRSAGSEVRTWTRSHSSSRWAGISARIHPSAATAWIVLHAPTGHDPLGLLTCDGRDPFEIGVVVQHGESGRFGRSSDDQIWNWQADTAARGMRARALLSIRYRAFTSATR